MSNKIEAPLPPPQSVLPTLPWCRFFKECLKPAFSALTSAGIRAFPDCTLDPPEVFECCGGCSHHALSNLTDGPYIFFHSQAINEEAASCIGDEKTVYGSYINEDGDSETNYDDVIEYGAFVGTEKEYASLDYRIIEKPSVTVHNDIQI